MICGRGNGSRAQDLRAEELPPAAATRHGLEGCGGELGGESLQRRN